MKILYSTKVVRLLTICTLLTISFWSCHESDQITPTKISKKGAREGADFVGEYVLDEVVIKAYRIQNDYSTFRIEIFDQWGNRPTGDFNPNEGISADFRNLETDSEFPRKFIEFCNQLMMRFRGFGLNDAEITILSNLSTDQQIKFGINLITAIHYQEGLIEKTFHDGYDKWSNAATHAYLASLHVKAFGLDLATRLVNAHESNQGDPNSPARVMDAYNNKIGLDYGERVRQNGTGIDSYIFINWAMSGWLYTIENGVAGHHSYPTSPTNPSPPKDQD